MKWHLKSKLFSGHGQKISHCLLHLQEKLGTIPHCLLHYEKWLSMFSYFPVQAKECPISHNIICHTSAQSKEDQEMWREIHCIRTPSKRFQTWLWWRSMSERWSRPLYLMYWGLGWLDCGLCGVSRILEGSSTERWCATFSITSSYVERLELHKQNVNVNAVIAAKELLACWYRLKYIQFNREVVFFWLLKQPEIYNLQIIALSVKTTNYGLSL